MKTKLPFVLCALCAFITGCNQQHYEFHQAGNSGGFAIWRCDRQTGKVSLGIVAKDNTQLWIDLP